VDLEALLYAERVDAIIDALESLYARGGATRRPAFDRAYGLVRRDRAARPPKDCPTTRMLVGRFFDDLYQELNIDT
jgi:hypothetical protein